MSSARCGPVWVKYLWRLVPHKTKGTKRATNMSIWCDRCGTWRPAEES